MADILTSCALVCLGMGLGHYLCRVAQYYDRLVTLDIAPEPYMLRQSLAGALCRHRDCPQSRRRYTPEPRLLPNVVGALIAAGYVILYVRLGLNLFTLALAWLLATLLLLALIDARTGLQPDALTLPLLWTGLALAWSGEGLITLEHAFACTMSIYLALWLFCEIYQVLRRRQGLGGGDIKLMAAIGAWIGWPDTLWVLIGGSLLGLILALLLQRGLRMTDAQPFGPPLIFATLTILAVRIGTIAG